MKISGDAILHGSADKVYAALCDPAVLVRTIPGCERLERVGPDAYTMVVSAGVAAVKGRYAGEVMLTDQEPPHRFTLKASGSGAPGTVSASVRVSLAGGDNGTTTLTTLTTLTYDADAVVGGAVGGVGQRVLAGVARRTAGEFFAAVDDVLTGLTGTAAVLPEAPEAVLPEAPEAAVSPEPVVFTRPAAPARRLPGGDFATGVVFGAVAALVGTVVGGLIARSAGIRSAGIRSAGIRSAGIRSAGIRSAGRRRP